jgi:hypothetical protein
MSLALFGIAIPTSPASPVHKKPPLALTPSCMFVGGLSEQNDLIPAFLHIIKRSSGVNPSDEAKPTASTHPTGLGAYA